MKRVERAYLCDALSSEGELERLEVGQFEARFERGVRRGAVRGKMGHGAHGGERVEESGRERRGRGSPAGGAGEPQPDTAVRVLGVVREVSQAVLGQDLEPLKLIQWARVQPWRA